MACPARNPHKIARIRIESELHAAQMMCYSASDCCGVLFGKTAICQTHRPVCRSCFELRDSLIRKVQEKSRHASVYEGSPISRNPKITGNN
jgi:hypothetical protein